MSKKEKGGIRRTDQEWDVLLGVGRFLVIGAFVVGGIEHFAPGTTHMIINAVRTGASDLIEIAKELKSGGGSNNGLDLVKQMSKMNRSGFPDELRSIIDPNNPVTIFFNQLFGPLHEVFGN